LFFFIYGIDAEIIRRKIFLCLNVSECILKVTGKAGDETGKAGDLF
jgi:hypothetical protein